MDMKSCYGAVLVGVMRVAGKDTSKKLDTWLRFGKKVNLKEPASLRDKVIYIENHCPSPLAAVCTDKWAARDYVAAKGYADALVPVYGQAYERVGDIPFHELPERYVLKATHGCKMNYFCQDKAKLDVDACKRTLNRWLRTTYGTYSGEWHYFNIPHRIYCEAYLDDADQMVDYKFHCMNGVPQFILVCRNRDAASGAGGQVERHIFDMSWNRLEGLLEPSDESIRPPAHLPEMIEMAETLSADFKFVRVDLYEINGKVYFGELTFTPAGGVFSHYTEAFLNDMGSRLTI